MHVGRNAHRPPISASGDRVPPPEHLEGAHGVEASGRAREFRISAMVRRFPSRHQSLSKTHAFGPSASEDFARVNQRKTLLISHQSLVLATQNRADLRGQPREPVIEELLV